MSTLTAKERLALEARYKQMIEQGYTQRQMAETLKVTPQAVSKFLMARGWKATPASTR